MAGQSQVRSLRRVNKSSNLSLDTTIMFPETLPQATLFIEPASTRLQNSSPSSSSSSSRKAYRATPPKPVQMDMRFREPQSYFHTGKNFPPKGHGYTAAIESALQTPTASLHAVGRFASSTLVKHGTQSLCRSSRSRGMSVGSFWHSRHRPSISEPSHPRLITPTADSKAMEQPLVRYATLTREENEFLRQSTTSPKQLRSHHNVDTPDPLRCHTAQPDDEVLPSAQSSAPYNSTDQHLTSNQRWQRRYEQEHRLVMDLQTQLVDAKREVEAQRTRAKHFQRAEAHAQKQSVKPYLAMESLEHREQIDNLVKKTAQLEQQFINANDARIRAEAIANKEVKSYNSLQHILGIRNSEIETLRDQLDESEARLEGYKLRCEELDEEVARNIIPVPQVEEPSSTLCTPENPNVPARTFSVLMKKIGRTQAEVNSTSNIDVLLPNPTQTPKTLQVAEPEPWNKQRSSTLRSFWLPQQPSLPAESSDQGQHEKKISSEEVEKKTKRGSTLRPFLLPQRLSLPIRQQEVPAHAPETSAYEEPLPEKIEFRSPILEPFPAYEESYPEAPYPQFPTVRKRSSASYQERMRRNGTEVFPEYFEPSPNQREEESFSQYSLLPYQHEQDRPAVVQTPQERFTLEDEDEDELEWLREYSDYLTMGSESGWRVSE